MSRCVAITGTVAATLAGGLAWAGHELPIYPSYYPHEIDIQTVAPEQAVDLTARGQIHAYAGAAPTPATLPGSVGAVELLGSFIVVTATSRCPGWLPGVLLMRLVQSSFAAAARSAW